MNRSERIYACCIAVGLAIIAGIAVGTLVGMQHCSFSALSCAF